MYEDKLHLSRWRKKIVTAWLIIAIAPVIPLLMMLIVLKLWALFWPVILAVVVVSLLVVGYRLVRATWWRWS
jgi:VIT1/CCC1 family predicted Fe2+/Mn2+ transporter